MAVIVVSGFSAFVDWKKEVEFVKRSQDDEDNKIVSKEGFLATLPAKNRYNFVYPD
jgi:hypothetical protein